MDEEAMAIMHLAQLPRILEEEENDPESKASQGFQKFLPVSILGRGVWTIPDSGNCWHSAISSQFMHTVGFQECQLKQVKKNKIATAKVGTHLRVLGQLPQPIPMVIYSDQGEKIVEMIQPHVVENLNSAVNISGPYMAERGWVHDLKTGTMKIKGKACSMKAPSKMKNRVKIQAIEDKECPANAVTFVTAFVPDNLNDREKSATVMPELDSKWATDRGLEPEAPLGSLHKLDNKQTLKLPIFNNTSLPVKIEKWEHIGQGVLMDESRKNKGALAEIISTEAALNLMEQKMSKPKQAEEENNKSGEKTNQAPEEDTRPWEDWTKEEIEKWFIEKYQLQDMETLRRKEDYEKALETLVKHFKIFSRDGNYGYTELITHRILTTEKGPIKQKPRPINPKLMEDLKKQLEAWVKQKIIEPSYGPWGANLVPALKSNGKLRWCIDYKDLNKITVKDSYPMPNVHHTIGKLAGSTIFSSVDMQGAFHCVAIHPADREKTAFHSPFGLFQMIRLGFGLTNGPATYCRLVDMILKDIPESEAIAFLDDGIIHSDDLQEHCRIMDKVFTAYGDAGLKINPNKCQLFRKEIDYLGHRVNAKGIKPTESYTKAIDELEVPRTKKGARRFLGVCNYYRNHIRNYAGQAKPWTAALSGENSKKQGPLVVTPEMEAAFKELKRLLTSAPVLGFAYFTGERAGRFILDTDFAQTQIGAVLSQEQTGQEVVIAYGSKTLNKAQRNYASTKGEMYAGTYFMNKYAFYLKYTGKFLWRTDNAALKWLHSMENPPTAVLRWRELHNDFDYEVQHRAGKAHTNADGLSRCDKPTLDDNTPDETEDIMEEWLEGKTLLPVADASIQAMQDLIPRENDQLNWAEEQSNDTSLEKLKKWLVGQERPTRETTNQLTKQERKYLGTMTQYRVKNGIIEHMPENAQEDQPWVKVVPEQRITEVVEKAHQVAGHMGLNKTMEHIKRKMYFPNMAKAITKMLEDCQECRTKTGPKAQKYHLAETTPAYPFEKLMVDFVGPIPKSSKGNQWILTVKDAFSKWVEAFPMRKATTDKAVEEITKNVMCRFGVPERIHSDCGAQFTSNFWKELGEKLGIRMTTTTPYHPRSNGGVERFHRDLQAIIKATTKGQYSNWEEALPAALFAMRTSKNEATGLAPYEIIFGREAATPLDLIFKAPEKQSKETDAKEKAQAIKERIQKAYQYARENLHKAVTRQRRNYHQQQRSFEVGQKVWLFTPNITVGEPNKFKTNWTGPWTICAPPINDLMVRLKAPEAWKIQGTKVVSVDRIRIYNEKEQKRPEGEITMPGDEFAESLEASNNRETSQPHPEEETRPRPEENSERHPEEETHRLPEEKKQRERKRKQEGDKRREKGEQSNKRARRPPNRLNL